MKKKLALLLALLMIAPSCYSCAESKENTESSEVSSDVGETAAAETETETEPNPYYDGYVDPFEGVKFDGATLTIYNSVNQIGTLTSSCYLIEGPEELTGDVAPDSAWQRNLDVMSMLDVDLSFVDCNYNYDGVASHIRSILQSGDTSYDLIINDIYGLAPITPEGLFHCIDDGRNFDFDNPWWYDGFMSDISINTNLRFILAGDFFIDMLRCSHCLIMNKDLYTDLYGNGDEVYEFVMNKEWTLDKFKSIIDGAYVDLNGNGVRDKDDQYGHTAFQYWGPMIPWLICSDPGFITRNEDGYPVIAVNNERSIALTEKLSAILNNDATAINPTGNESETETESVFFEGRSLFLGYQRLASLENANFRDSDIDLAVLPYPMLDENQKSYVSSTHDTAELGFIPISVPEDRLDFISTVVEVLCRETYAQVLPAYYESSLKIKYTRDQKSAQMIDIIHDNFGNGFALAFSNGLNGILLNTTFYAAIESKSLDFVSKYKVQEKVANKLLDKMTTSCDNLLEERKAQ
ncbi:MAG: hypothetical protein ACI4XJ_11555 [Eubacteriales bacterium]